jgi:4-amino-4-deoxy-L-arabinose transferase-like glycosyltransferase
MNPTGAGTAASSAGRLRGGDYLLLAVLCAALYGVGAVSGRPLSVHEARLPQLAREMAQGQSDWILPQSGGRPWLERPPLPHWLTAASMRAFCRTDALWVVRIPAAAAGMAVVLLGAWMSARWFGRVGGLLAGVVIATSYELYQYATLAEDDVYLAMVVAACVGAFVKAEWPVAVGTAARDVAVPARGGWVRQFLSPRREWPTLAFFVLLGLTNLAKGPLVGAAPVIGAVVLFLTWNGNAGSARRYVWLWGWLIFLGLTAAWPWWAQGHYPDVWDNWRFDYLGQSEGGGAHQWDEPWWYYLKMLPLALAPWTWATVIGLWVTACHAWRVRGSAQRFLWCWALAGLAVLSMPARKHHHYLVPLILPWATLGALGLQAVGKRLGAPAASRRPPGSRLDARRWLLGATVVAGAACAAWVQFRLAGRDPGTLAEQRFLREVEAAVPAGEPVYVNADVGSLGFFRLQFTLRRWQRLLHNLSYLRDRELAAPVVWVVTRERDERALGLLGETRALARASASARGSSRGQAFTLFRVAFRPDLARYPRPPYVGVMQAMGRKKGPWCDEGDGPGVETGQAGTPPAREPIRAPMGPKIH